MKENKFVNDKTEDCGTCPLDSTRREFLRDAALAVAGIVTALGMPSRAEALRLLRPLSINGKNVTYPIPAADGVTIDKDNQVILVRNQGALYAFALSCPHQRTALKWKEDDSRFQCPKHKSKYQPDGTFISGRATRGMDRYALKKKGAEVLVDVGTLFKEDKDKAGWTAAVVTLGASSVR